MKVSLICPVYNERDSISSLIKSMLNQTKKPNEIIFVDSFSNDGTGEIIKKGVVLIQKARKKLKNEKMKKIHTETLK